MFFRSFQLDTAEEVALNRLRVRAEKCLHCAILTYKIANEVETHCSGKSERSARQGVKSNETNVSNTPVLINKLDNMIHVKREIEAINYKFGLVIPCEHLCL